MSRSLLCADAVREALLARKAPTSVVDRLFARAAVATDPPGPVVDGPAAWRLIDRIAATLADEPGPRHATTRAVAEVGPELDFLGETRSDVRHETAFLRDLNLLAQENLRARGKAAVVATVRNEGPYLLEWLGHLRAVGFEHVFVYTNDNTDGSDALLLALDRHGIITLCANSVGPSINPQIKAYDHALHFMPEVRDYSWVMFLDADEFFVPAARYGHQVGAMLDDAVARWGLDELASISFNWIWMGSDGQRAERLEQPLTRRFVKGLLHHYVKSIVRPAAVRSMLRVHKPVLFAPYFGIGGDFNLIDMSGHATDPVQEFGDIRHYWHKSFEEFLVKQARGADRAIWQRDAELFFLWDHGDGGLAYGMPDALVEHAARETEAWLAVPDIAEAHRSALEGYRRLAADTRSGRSIEDLYEAAEGDTRIFRVLTEAPAGGSTAGAAEARELASALSDILAGR